MHSSDGVLRHGHRHRLTTNPPRTPSPGACNWASTRTLAEGTQLASTKRR